MKRTFTANIDGQVFHIDEDAYNLLGNYLNQLHTAFPGAEGAEIVSDIESRIRELLCERPCGPEAVVTIAHISSIITTMGRPEDLGCATEAQQPAMECPPPLPVSNQPEVRTSKKLYRDMQNKVFGGVIGGLAAYLGWNASIMRLLIIILALCTKILPITIIYLIAWMVIPAAVSPAQVLRMRGKPVTPSSMGQAVMEEAYPHPDGGFWRTLAQIGGKVAITILGIVGCIIATVGCIALMVEVAGMIAYAGYGSEAILEFFGMFEIEAPILFCVQTVLWTLFAILMGGAAAWLAGCVVLGVRGASRATFATGTVMAIILFTAALIITAICSEII